MCVRVGKDCDVKDAIVRRRRRKKKKGSDGRRMRMLTVV